MTITIPASIRVAFERTDHPFYMWEELWKTPAALQSILTEPNKETIRQAANSMLATDLVHLVGCGTSYFSSIAGMYAFHQLAAMRAQAHNAFEFSAYPSVGLGGTTVIATSHTGTTSAVLDSVALAKREGAFTIAITDVDDSALAIAVGRVIEGGGGREKQLPKTRSYVSSLLKTYLLAAAVAEQQGRDVADLADRLADAPATAQTVLDENHELTRIIAEDVATTAQVYLFGGGPHVASAAEGTLKLQETVQVRAFGFELEEGMHGPWVTMQPSDLVIVFAVRGPSFEKAKRFVQAISKLGVKLWVLSDDPDGVPEATYRTRLPNVPEVTSPLFATLPLYEFAYQIAILRGIRPDVMRLTEEAYLAARLQLPR